MSGYIGLLLLLIIGIGGIGAGIALRMPGLAIVSFIIGIFLAIGLTAVSPN